MAVRVKLKTGKGQVVTSALANTGFETEEPEVVLPLKVAELLGIYPSPPPGSTLEEYSAVGGPESQS